MRPISGTASSMIAPPIYTQTEHLIWTLYEIELTIREHPSNNISERQMSAYTF